MHAGGYNVYSTHPFKTTRGPTMCLSLCGTCSVLSAISNLEAWKRLPDPQTCSQFGLGQKVNRPTCPLK